MYIQNDFSYSCEKNVMGSILNIQNFCTQNIQSINLQCLKTIMSKGKLLISQFQISRIVYTELLL